MADPRLRSLRGPFALALVLHIVLLILFALNFEASQRSAETAQPDIIEAVVLDDSRIAAEAERLKTEAAPPAETGPEPVSTPNPEESRRAQQIEAEKAAEESRRQMEAKKLADQARKDEQRRKAEAEEKARAAAEAAARKKAEAEAKEKAEAEARRRAAEEARAKAAA
ncbi:MULTISPECIES: cell envelope integrity protein TolA, partial [unclassified Methylococcus]|uniref:cell envelope integrity protein TolA n=1 Tax=unclassified Methylococcus TaxID=2618889 RepID=UPI003D7C6D36